MRKFLFVVLFIQLSLFSAYADNNCVGTGCMPQPVKEDCTVSRNNGCIDWSNGVIYAVGMGVPNPKFSSQAQKNYSAYQAAKTVAMRNLLQMVQDVNITSSTTVKEGMLENDTIQTQISGKLRHVQEVGQPVQKGDSSVWVTMKLYVRDILPILLGNQPFASQGSSSPFQQEQPQDQPKAAVDEDRASKIYTGLIIDASNTGLTPALSPKVLDESGREVYGSAYVSRDFAVTQGMIGYAKELEKAQKNQRVAGSPLIVSAVRSEGANQSDIIISNKDAELLRSVNKTQTFLREARVMVLLK